MNIFIHIPKTAGTALGHIFDFGSERRIFWDYDSNYENYDKVKKSIYDNREFIESHFWGLIGHFYYVKYAETFPKARFMTCLRHPIDRLISQYNHEVFDAITTNQDHWKLNAMRQGTDIIEWFHMDPNVGTVLTNHTIGRDIDDYDFVFLTELLEPLLELFVKKYNFVRRDAFGSSFPVINDASHRSFDNEELKEKYTKLTTITEQHRLKLFNFIEMDAELYSKAMERAKVLLSEL